MYFGINKMATEMGISVVASALVLAFINIEKFEFFKGAGFEAKLKEVKKATDEAYATIEALKAVAAPIIAENLHSITWAMRLTQRNIKEKIEIKNELDKVIELLQLKHELLTKEENDFHKINILDLFNEIIKMIENSNSNKDILKILNQKKQKYLIMGHILQKMKFINF